MWEKWLLDVTLGIEFPAWVPHEDDGSVVVGMTLIGEKPPGEPVGIFHSAGVEAAEKFIAEHQAELEAIFIKARGEEDA